MPTATLTILSCTIKLVLMPFPVLFLEDFLHAAPYIFFVYHMAELRVTYVNPAYERVLLGHCAQVNDELPGLLARVHPGRAAGAPISAGVG
ncbi:hypothetical protein [Hymenobacter sp. YC55]|uniref:hypothetical protein n=1 Tax=Hymenobacter sp. YC55 TaxID=3034019 RepID=UPI0023F68379|nr:hypothetical protein [Hymenobacter sp. YC55]MDF7814965.1 hypothetical protein [Hymenobacter sp. YC55]